MMFCFPKQMSSGRSAMNKFIERFSSGIAGVLSGFDRLVFRGSLRQLQHGGGMMSYLWHQRVLLKNFAQHVQQISERVRTASLRAAQEQKRPIRYLHSSQVSKEDIARKIAAQDQIREGLVCVLTCVEPCMSYEVRRNADSKQLELASCMRKCLHLYHYWVHPRLGFLHARLQTWFPFAIQVCLNGREWLARQMDQVKMQYQRYDNCFGHVESFAQAQQLLEQQGKVRWPQLLDPIARQLNPVHAEMLGNFAPRYYWTTYQSEWAMDIVFRNPEQLRRLYPKLLHLGIHSFSSPQVLRFLGKKTTMAGEVPGTVSQQVTTDLRQRQEGVRIKHAVGRNSVKLYDKLYTPGAAVLRLEATINEPKEFLVYRPKEGDAQGPRSWRIMRRGVADLHRRTQISDKIVNRYADALASVEDNATLEELTASLERRVNWNGKWVRALHPFTPEDRGLLQAVNRGEFTVHGFRNRDLQRLLYSSPAVSPTEARRRSSAVSRKLRLLRAHGLIQKLPHTHRYQVTSSGRMIITAVLVARHATLKQLAAIAA
jgi:hypothetical protein